MLFFFRARGHESNPGANYLTPFAFSQLACTFKSDIWRGPDLKDRIRASEMRPLSVGRVERQGGRGERPKGPTNCKIAPKTQRRAPPPPFVINLCVPPVVRPGPVRMKKQARWKRQRERERKRDGEGEKEGERERKKGERVFFGGGLGEATRCAMRVRWWRWCLSPPVPAAPLPLSLALLLPHFSLSSC